MAKDYLGERTPEKKAADEAAAEKAKTLHEV